MAVPTIIPRCLARNCASDEQVLAAARVGDGRDRGVPDHGDLGEARVIEGAIVFIVAALVGAAIFIAGLFIGAYLGRLLP